MLWHGALSMHAALQQHCVKTVMAMLQMHASADAVFAGPYCSTLQQLCVDEQLVDAQHSN